MWIRTRKLHWQTKSSLSHEPVLQGCQPPEQPPLLSVQLQARCSKSWTDSPASCEFQHLEFTQVLMWEDKLCSGKHKLVLQVRIYSVKHNTHKTEFAASVSSPITKVTYWLLSFLFCLFTNQNSHRATLHMTNIRCSDITITHMSAWCNSRALRKKKGTIYPKHL